MKSVQLAMHTRIVQGYPVQYLKEVTRESFPTYAGFKQKAGYSLPAEEVSRLSEEFVTRLHEVLANLIFDEIWVPETSNLAFLSVVSRIAGDKPVYRGHRKTSSNSAWKAKPSFSRRRPDWAGI